jgi:hypothetical protein
MKTDLCFNLANIHPQCLASIALGCQFIAYLEHASRKDDLMVVAIVNRIDTQLSDSYVN